MSDDELNVLIVTFSFYTPTPPMWAEQIITMLDMIANLDANAFNVLQAEYKANRLQPTNTPSLITRSCFSLLLLL